MNFRFLAALLCTLSLCAGAATTTAAEAVFGQDIILLAANSSDDGKGSEAGQARAKKLALKKNKDIIRVLGVKRQTGGYMVKLLKNENRIKEVWIAD